ncbi:MAG: 3-oxoacyl-ACP synthase [Bacteroidetes bacterium]|nr:3-oxoacyl-ACP synthase [Fibrella sp.]
MTPTDIKNALYIHCQTYVEMRITNARQAMEAAQDSANSESKSSAGDKYETGRAMAQLERDRHATLLADAVKQQQELGQIDVHKAYHTIQPGSIVTTSQGNYFISISAGKIVVDNVTYFAVSPVSPIAIALKNKTTGDRVIFNKTTYHITEVC